MRWPEIPPYAFVADILDKESLLSQILVTSPKLLFGWYFSDVYELLMMG
jgi:hypothetical protein